MLPDWQQNLDSKLWFDALVRKLVRDIKISLRPFGLRGWIKGHWSAFCETHPAFPDNLTMSAISRALDPYQIHVIDHEIAIPEEVLSEWPHIVVNLFQVVGNPLEFSIIISQLFPDLDLPQNQHQKTLSFLKSHLDKRFVEVLPDLIVLIDLLRFRADTFECFFQSQYQPLSTRELIGRYLGIQPAHFNQISSRMLNIGNAELSHNPNLLSVQKSYWLPRSTCEQMVDKALSYWNKVTNQSQAPISLSKVLMYLLHLCLRASLLVNFGIGLLYLI